MTTPPWCRDKVMVYYYYKILQCYVNYYYYYCVFIMEDKPSRLLFFLPAFLFSILTPLFLPTSSVSLTYFILVVPMHECLGKHSCMSSTFPIGYIAILNSTSFFHSVKAMNNWKLTAIKEILLK